MLHPSYTDLMKEINGTQDYDETQVENSRYSVVMGTAKRAREIVDGSMPYVDMKKSDKPLSVAVDELYQGKIRIVSGKEAESEAEAEPEVEAEAEPEAEAEAEAETEEE